MVPGDPAENQQLWLLLLLLLLFVVVLSLFNVIS